MSADGFVELSKNKLEKEDGVHEINRMFQHLYDLVGGDGDKVRVYSGYGTPLNVIAAGVGALYLRYDGSAGTTLYTKESGTDASGWAAVTGGGGGGEANTASNVGVGQGLFFKQKTGVDLEFKTALEGANIDITDGVSEVTFKAIPTAPDKSVQFNDGGSTFGGDAGFIYNKTSDHLAVGGGTAAIDQGVYGLPGNETAENAMSQVINARETVTSLSSSHAAIVGELVMNPTLAGTDDYQYGILGSLRTPSSNSTSFGGQFFSSAIRGQWMHEGTSTASGFSIAAISASGSNQGAGRISNAAAIYATSPKNASTGIMNSSYAIYLTEASHNTQPTNSTGISIDQFSDAATFSANIYSSSTAPTGNEAWGLNIFEGPTGIGEGVLQTGPPTYIKAYLTIDPADKSSVTQEKITFLSDARTLTLTSGTTITNMRINQFMAPTLNGIAGGGTETVTNSATVYISAAPSGSNITLTNAYSFWVDAGVSRFDGNLDFSPADATNIILGSTTGSKIGTAITQKLGFWNATPITQPASANQAAVATTAATNVTPYGYTTAAQADGIITLLNEIRTVLVNEGLMKGAA